MSYLQENNYIDKRVITRGELVRLFDVVRASVKQDFDNHICRYPELLKIDSAKEELLTALIILLKE